MSSKKPSSVKSLDELLAELAVLEADVDKLDHRGLWEVALAVDHDKQAEEGIPRCWRCHKCRKFNDIMPSGVLPDSNTRCTSIQFPRCQDSIVGTGHAFCHECDLFDVDAIVMEYHSPERAPMPENWTSASSSSK
ncbi:hypothetical protein MMC30_001943 [Trapelia coarctata]|nr:hypothetical protein [Trapelia coarctata]